MSEATFTQEQVNEAVQNAKQEWVEQEFNPIVTERDELLQYKPKDLTDDEKAIQQKQQDLFQKEINLELKENGLEQFTSIIKVEDTDQLKEVVKSLKQITNDIKIANGYIPKDHAADDEYTKFTKEKNTTGMIGSKLANLFK
ncbi:hypothetical protein SAMN05421663_104161 [Terribacillus halophilus]|uniref:DUF4355 domain-containing protein n=1 Tax=Terribacillus halophilus TaxID=361279 RepID=A0A1G6PM07_9BACI|nr:hypothetical protein [Terribacillus halophilus]SDC80546.1 hypothetical protein SAMN05421663_104161 [Terribacillus halophilus]